MYTDLITGEVIDENSIVEDNNEDGFSSSSQMKSKRLSPFDIIGMMFKDPQGFENLTDATLVQNFFMINRTLAINYPLQAQFFNRLNIPMAQTIRAWKSFLLKKHPQGQVPKFVFTKGSKKSDEISRKEHKLDKDAITNYCIRYGLSMKDFNDLLEFFPDELIADVNGYEHLSSKREMEKSIKMTEKKEKKSRKKKETTN